MSLPNYTYYTNLIKGVANYLKSEFGVKQISLFGSFARGEEKDDSDIDLFIDMPPKAMKLVELKYFLQDLLNKPVDIVRERDSIDPFLLQEIKRDAIPIFPIPFQQETDYTSY